MKTTINEAVCPLLGSSIWAELATATRYCDSLIKVTGDRKTWPPDTMAMNGNTRMALVSLMRRSEQLADSIAKVVAIGLPAA